MVFGLRDTSLIQTSLNITMVGGNTLLDTDIKNKKILFFAPAFFRYEHAIAEKMREFGAQVDMYDVRTVTDAFSRALLKISPDIFRKRSQTYYEKILDDNRGKNYDYVLIVKCDMTPASILKKIKVEFPNAKLCLYLWDSVENIPGVTDKFKYFDTLHSFDPKDCEKYPILKFRPLFFVDQFRKNLKDGDYKYDISFLGTIHSDRYAVIKEIQKISAEKQLHCYWFLYLQSRFIYKFYKFTKKEFRGTKEDAFAFEKMSALEISKIADDTRIILDIQHPKQTGLTMRTVEMIGMNKKLITTNDTIKNYDFYNPNNIAIIDRNNVNIDCSFLSMPYQPIDDDIYENYSLRSWILDVLS